MINRSRRRALTLHRVKSGVFRRVNRLVFEELGIVPGSTARLRFMVCYFGRRGLRVFFMYVQGPCGPGVPEAARHSSADPSTRASKCQDFARGSSAAKTQGTSH